MDFMLFWVVLAITVEGSRMVMKKLCPRRPLKEKEGLEERLLKTSEIVDTWEQCRLPCCAHRWEDEEKAVKLHSNLDDTGSQTRDEFELEKGEEDLLVPPLRRLIDQNGKRPVKDSEEEITSEEDFQIPEVVFLRESRDKKGKSSSKIYPLPPGMDLESNAHIHGSDYKSMRTGQCSYQYDQGNPEIESDLPSTGESSTPV